MIRRRFLDLCFLVVSSALVPAAAQQSKFAGVWEARFKGEAFMTLKVAAGDPISGSLSGGHIGVNDDGDLTEASGGGKEHPILSPKVDGDILSFQWKEDDEETLKFEMRLTGDGEAMLQFMDVPEGHTIKPIPIRRK
jgi:hypothetical protein